MTYESKLTHQIAYPGGYDIAAYKADAAVVASAAYAKAFATYKAAVQEAEKAKTAYNDASDVANKAKAACKIAANAAVDAALAAIKAT